MVHQGFPEDKSISIVEALANALVFFKNSVRAATAVSLSIDNEFLLNAVQKFVRNIQILKTMDSQNYPNGENHIQTLRREQFSPQHIDSLVYNLYGRSKKLEYTDSRNDKISINNQEALEYAVSDSAKQYYEEYIRSLQLLGKPLPNPFVIPQVEVKLIVSTPPLGSVPSSFQSNYNDLASQFTNNKELMLRDLSALHSISINELEIIYGEFCRVSRGRRVDGRITRQEFADIMQGKLQNYEAVNQFFDAIDDSGNGFVDFRSFIAALGVFRNNHSDGKLMIAFKAYCKTEYWFIYKADLFNLLRENDLTKTYQEKTLCVEQIFQWFDVDRDGKLNFNEFRSAYINNWFTLEMFWNGYNMISFEEILVPCVQCARKMPIRAGRGTPGACDECMRFHPIQSPYMQSL